MDCISQFIQAPLSAIIYKKKKKKNCCSAALRDDWTQFKVILTAVLVQQK